MTSLERVGGGSPVSRSSSSGVDSSSVGDIFKAAGVAFQRLGELTNSLHDQNESRSNNSKWTETEVAFFRASLHRFSSDLLALSSHVRRKTEEQMKVSCKRKAYEDAGVSSEKACAYAAQTVKASSKPENLRISSGDYTLMTPTKKSKIDDMPLLIDDKPERVNVSEDELDSAPHDEDVEDYLEENGLGPTNLFPLHREKDQ